jgi:hypothetical protein
LPAQRYSSSFQHLINGHPAWPAQLVVTRLAPAGRFT